MKKISQREARALRRRVEMLELAATAERNAWCRDYPGGVHIGWQEVTLETIARVKTARLLGHPVVVVPSNKDNCIGFYAVE